MEPLSIKALKMRYSQTLVGIFQASIFSFGWFFRLVVGPHGPHDWGVWLWVAFGWTALPGMGFWRDRKAWLKKQAETPADT